MPDLMGHAVGKERFELLARQAGEDVSHSYTHRSKLFTYL